MLNTKRQPYVLKAKDNRYHIIYWDLIGRATISVMSFYSKQSAENWLIKYVKQLAR